MFRAYLQQTREQTQMQLWSHRLLLLTSSRFAPVSGALDLALGQGE
jgi:hypothetical protein